MNRLDGFGDGLNIAVFGASGGIGQALCEQAADLGNVDRVFAISRNEVAGHTKINAVKVASYNDTELAWVLADLPQLDIAICAIGTLHGDKFSPEKSMSELNVSAMRDVFEVNTIAPSIIAKHTLPKFHRDRKTVFAALSARVGSISDNRLGGWYSYRASKAALNMMIKSLAIEHGRKNRQSAVIALHPGTVDTDLSKPFQSNVADGKLFSPDFSAARLLDVIEKVTASDSGKILAWDGEEITP